MLSWKHLLVDAGERAPAPTVRQGTQARRLSDGR